MARINPNNNWNNRHNNWHMGTNCINKIKTSFTPILFFFCKKTAINTQTLTYKKTILLKTVEKHEKNHKNNHDNSSSCCIL